MCSASGEPSGIRLRKHPVQRVSEDILTPLDMVTFYLTSSRVFLQGERKNLRSRWAHGKHAAG